MLKVNCTNPKYDAPFPYDFNSWSQVDRTRWSMEHSVSRSGREEFRFRSSSGALFRSSPERFRAGFKNEDTTEGTAPPSLRWDCPVARIVGVHHG